MRGFYTHHVVLSGQVLRTFAFENTSEDHAVQSAITD